MPVIRQTAARGFNLVETLVATVVLSGVVTSAGAISSRALVASRVNRLYETAAAVVDRQMSLIDYMGVDALLAQGQTEGSQSEGDMTYKWVVTTEYQDIDLLYKVTVTVQWSDRGRVYSLKMDTLFDGTATQGLSAQGTNATQGTQQDTTPAAAR